MESVPEICPVSNLATLIDAAVAEIQEDDALRFTMDDMEFCKMPGKIQITAPPKSQLRLKIFSVRPEYGESKRGASLSLAAVDHDELHNFATEMAAKLFPDCVFKNTSLQRNAQYGDSLRIKFTDDSFDEGTWLLQPSGNENDAPTGVLAKTVDELPSDCEAMLMEVRALFYRNGSQEVGVTYTVIKSALMPKIAVTADWSTFAAQTLRWEQDALLSESASTKLEHDTPVRVFADTKYGKPGATLRSDDPRLLELGRKLDAAAGDMQHPLVKTSEYGPQIRLKVTATQVIHDDANVGIDDVPRDALLKAGTVLTLKGWTMDGGRGLTLYAERPHFVTSAEPPLKRPRSASLSVFDGPGPESCRFDELKLSIKSRENAAPLLYFDYDNVSAASFLLTSSAQNVVIDNPPLPEQYQVADKIPGIFARIRPQSSTETLVREIDEAALRYVKNNAKTILGHAFTEAQIEDAWRPVVNDSNKVKIKLPGEDVAVWMQGGSGNYTSVSVRDIPSTGYANIRFQPYVYFTGEFKKSKKRLIMAGVQLSASAIRLDDNQLQHKVGDRVELCPGLMLTVQ